MRTTLILCGLSLLCSVYATAAVKVVDLRCEFQLNHHTVTTPQPRFGWGFETDQTSFQQASYQILASSSAAALGDDRGDLWDSGEKVGYQCQFVPYGAEKPLEPGQKVFWKVRVKDASGAFSPWSAPASFEVGKADAEPPSPIFPAGGPVLSKIETSDPNLNRIFGATPKALAKIDNLRDAALSLRAASYFNAQASANAEKWFIQLNQSVNAGGLYPASLPAEGEFISTFSDAPIWFIHHFWRTTGDNTTLRTYWPQMMTYFQTRRRLDEDVVGKAMGTLPPDSLPKGDRTPKAFIHLLSQAFDARLMHEMVRPATDNPFPVLKLRQSFSAFAESFRKLHIRKDGALKYPSLTAHLLALRSGLISEDEKTKKKIIGDTLSLLKKQKGSPFAQSPYATQSLLPVLTFSGNLDEAVKIASAQDPAKLSPLARACISEWLIAMVAGIDCEALGYHHIRISPQIPSPDVLKFAKAQFDSLHGRISVHWRYEGDDLLLDATVPTNTTVLFQLPAKEGQSIFEGGKPIEQSKRFSNFGRGKKAAAMRAGAGSYSFKITD